MSFFLKWGDFFSTWGELSFRASLATLFFQGISIFLREIGSFSLVKMELPNLPLGGEIFLEFFQCFLFTLIYLPFWCLIPKGGNFMDQSKPKLSNTKNHHRC
jgi:hypothetical protein